MADSREAGEEERKLAAEVDRLSGEIRAELLVVPNLPAPECPDGAGEADNVVVRVEGYDAAAYGPHQRVPHWDIGAELGILDLERGAKLSGSMFVMYRGAGASLVRALVPAGARPQRRRLRGDPARPRWCSPTRWSRPATCPKFVDDAYHLERDDLWAIPTAEVPLTSLARDEILDEARLPMRLMAHTSCFRREAGSAGRDTRGLLRVHEFDKVEILAYATPAQAPDVHAELLRRAEAVIADLGLAYRIVDLCTGDLGNSSARTFDIEVYAPGVDRWLEVSSVSWFSDYQARRANVRYRPAEGKGTEVVHTLNGSALAVPRVWAALVETVAATRRPGRRARGPAALPGWPGAADQRADGGGCRAGVVARVITTLEILHPDPAELVGRGQRRPPHAEGHPPGGVRAGRVDPRAGGQGGASCSTASRRSGTPASTRARWCPSPTRSNAVASTRRWRRRARGWSWSWGRAPAFGTPYLCERYGRVVAVDLSLEMLRHAGAGGAPGAGRRRPAPTRRARRGGAGARQHAAVPGRGRAGRGTGRRPGVGQLAGRADAHPPAGRRRGPGAARPLGRCRVAGRRRLLVRRCAVPADRRQGWRGPRAPGEAAPQLRGGAVRPRRRRRRTLRPVRPLVRRGRIERAPRGQRGGAGHRHGGRPPLRTPRAGEGRGARGVRALHQLRQPQGRGVGRQPVGGAGFRLGARSVARSWPKAPSSGSRRRRATRTSPPDPAPANSAPGRRPSPRRLAPEPSSTRPGRPPPTASEPGRCPARPTGAAIACARSASSSGRADRTGCTTGSSTRQRPAAGTGAGWPLERQTPAPGARPPPVTAGGARPRRPRGAGGRGPPGRAPGGRRRSAPASM